MDQQPDVSNNLAENSGVADDDASSVYSEYVPSVHSSDEDDNNSASCPSSEFESEEDGDGYTRRDFPDVKMTPGQLQRFNAAYEEFLEMVQDVAGTQDKEPMLLEKPNALRPVPQTMQDFLIAMPLVNIGEQAVNHKNEIEKRLVQAIDVHTPEDMHNDEDVHDAEQKQTAEQISVFEAVCTGCEKVARKKDWQRLMELLLVSCTVLFDEQAHLLFTRHSPVDRVSSILARLGKCWRAVFAQRPKDLKIAEQTHEHLKHYLLSCQQTLNEGGYCLATTAHANPFRQTVLPFNPVEGQVENFGEDPGTPRIASNDDKSKSNPAKGDSSSRSSIARSGSTTFNLPDIKKPVIKKQDSWQTKPSDFVVNEEDDSDVEEINDDDVLALGEGDDATECSSTMPNGSPKSSVASPATRVFKRAQEMGQYLMAEEAAAAAKDSHSPRPSPNKRRRTYVAPWEERKPEPPAQEHPTPAQVQQQQVQAQAQAAATQQILYQQQMQIQSLQMQMQQQQQRQQQYLVMQPQVTMGMQAMGPIQMVQSGNGNVVVASAQNQQMPSRLSTSSASGTNSSSRLVTNNQMVLDKNKNS